MRFKRICRLMISILFPAILTPLPLHAGESRESLLTRGIELLEKQETEKGLTLLKRANAGRVSGQQKRLHGFNLIWDRNPDLALSLFREVSAERLASELLETARQYRDEKAYRKAEKAARLALVYARSAEQLDAQLQNLQSEYPSSGNDRSSLLENVYIELIRIVRIQKEPEKISRAYGEAISDIDSPYLLFRRAKWHAEREDYPAAIRDMSSAEIGYRRKAGKANDLLRERWLTEDANEAIGWRGFYHAMTGNYKQALIDIEVALQNEHNRGRWLANRAMIHEMAGNRALAKRDAEMALIELEPDTRHESEDTRLARRADEAAKLLTRMEAILATE